MFFYGVDATKKPTAAPLGADNTHRSPFLCPQEESDLRAFFRMSRSAFSLATSRLRRAISSCSGFIWPWPGKATWRRSAPRAIPSRSGRSERSLAICTGLLIGSHSVRDQDGRDGIDRGLL